MGKRTEPDELDVIHEAQMVRGIPLDQPLVPYHSIGELLDQQASRAPSEIFLITRDEDRAIRDTLSYAQLLSLTNRAANYLRHGLGLQVGDRLATVMYNHRLTVETFFAALKVGIVVVPIDAELEDAQIADHLQSSGAKAVFVRVEYLDRVAPIVKAIPTIETLVQVSGRDHGFPLYEKAIARCAKHLQQPPDIDLHGDALIVYPSGDHGPGHPILLSHYNLLVSASEIVKWHHFTPEDRIMAALPIHQPYGTVASLLTPLYSGGSAVLTRVFHPHHFWEAVAEEGVTCLTLTPPFLQQLLDDAEDIGQHNISHLTHIICGDGPPSIELQQRFEERFQIPLIVGYNRAECTAFSSFLPLDLPEEERHQWVRSHDAPCVGIPLDSNEMAIHTPTGSPQGPNRQGEIVIRGHNVMQRYVGNPDATLVAFQHGWLRTGDEGFVVDDEGGRPFFFLTGKIEESAPPVDSAGT